MQNKHVFIFTECSEEIGLGHISRCCAFYEEFERLGCACCFIIDGTGQPLNFLINKKHRFIPWKKVEADLSFLKKEDIIFADTITATQQELERLAKLVGTFAIIDDYCRRSYKNTIIIDWTPGVMQSGKHRHNIGNGNKLLLDLNYSVLRPQFTDKVHLRKNCKIITIIMGGSDYRKLSHRLTNCIAEHYPDKSVHVVIGPLAEAFETNIPNVILHKSLCADELMKLFKKSDIVVSAGGQTLFELAAMQIPTIGIQVVDNQKEDMEGFLKVGFLRQNIQWDSAHLEKKTLDEINWFTNVSNRKFWKKNLTYKEIGNGAKLITTEIVNE